MMNKEKSQVVLIKETTPIGDVKYYVECNGSYISNSIVLCDHDLSDEAKQQKYKDAMLKFNHITELVKSNQNILGRETLITREL